MHAFLLLWTVVATAAAAVALSVPLGGGPAMHSGVRRLGKRGWEEERITAVYIVSRCMWESWVYENGETLKSCIKQHGVEKYRLSAEEVKSSWIDLCMDMSERANRELCEIRAKRLFVGRDNRTPFGLRGRVADLYRGVARTGGAVIRGVQRATGRAWSWAKSKFNRPSAFQTSAVREKEVAGAMHPLRPILVGE
ncbi:MAG: hypothetical protein M1826_003282 [Phylliscum demangeonii]|nr:MAG: hypothetical protein M1826_003282 [Phylliscum demangeonii]